MLVLIYELTLSRGLLLLLSFAEQKVISTNSKVASAIFTQDFMIVNSTKTCTRALSSSHRLH